MNQTQQIRKVDYLARIYKRQGKDCGFHRGKATLVAPLHPPWAAALSRLQTPDIEYSCRWNHLREIMIGSRAKYTPLTTQETYLSSSWEKFQQSLRRMTASTASWRLSAI